MKQQLAASKKRVSPVSDKNSSSKLSRRARRMDRHNKQGKKPALNLVSLMDIFTILVFFLLVSSSNVQQLPSKKDIKLPVSVATKTPKETIVISITRTSILVQGRSIGNINDIMSDPADLIPGLEQELNFQASNTGITITAEDQAKGKAVTILGDENISYDLLRKILATCREANYTQVAFAAIQKAKS